MPWSADVSVVVIGGHTRNIGKTSMMCALIREFSSNGWTAVKITQYGHGVCSHDGHSCGCAPTEHPFALTEEIDPQGRADTCRYLSAGARKSLWLRARQGQLASALPLLFRRLHSAQWVIIESNSIMDFIEPLLYLAVLDGSRSDFKPSAQRSLARADALVAVSAAGTEFSAGTADGERVAISARADAAIWRDLDLDHHGFRAKPRFGVRAPDYWSSALAGFVRGKLDEVAGTAQAATAIDLGRVARA
jgi:molybdopterin-guanine dinucleotide biosynthesis protein